MQAVIMSFLESVTLCQASFLHCQSLRRIAVAQTLDLCSQNSDASESLVNVRTSRGVGV